MGKEGGDENGEENIVTPAPSSNFSNLFATNYYKRRKAPVRSSSWKITSVAHLSKGANSYGSDFSYTAGNGISHVRHGTPHRQGENR
jgi:hypothetical protein